MANDLDDLDETRGDPQPAKAAGWSSSTSGTRPSCRDPGCSKGAPAWPARPGRRCCICCEGAAGRQTVAMRPRRSRAAPLTRSAFAGFCFPSDVIVLAVRWYLRFGLSYRDVEELLADRGVEVDHTTIYCWVQRFTPLLVDAARPCRHAVGDRWQADESYAKVAGRWRYIYRAIDQFGQVIDVFVSPKRDAKAAPPLLGAGHRHHQAHARGGRHRQGGDLPDRAGRIAPGGVASHRPRHCCI
jgi:hypothetical protein